ncbi:MAG: alpha/beta hydrolase [Candidatus Nanopelagicales bacterium]
MTPPRRAHPAAARRSAAAVIAALAAVSVAVLLQAPAVAVASPRPSLPAADQPPADQPPADLAAFYGQALAWEPCGEGLSCAWLTVPLDYLAPSGATIRIKVARYRATGSPALRQGSVLVNPGGPGGSGVDFTGYVAEYVAPDVAAEFDIVGFDPRGVGQSAPITCLTGRQTSAWLATDGSPSTRAQERLLMRRAAQIARGCLRMSPTLARQVGTENTVRDMDILRQALGDSRLNWLGFSYGTYLGTRYAEVFPDRVGRMVLDGALDPSLGAMEISEGQSRGFQRALKRFAADCAERSSCPYPGSARAVLRGINVLLAGLDRSPMPTGQGRPLNQAEAITAVFYPMYSPLLWPTLRRALGRAAAGDGSGMLAISDLASDRTGPDSFGSNIASAFYAISCWDLPAPPGSAGLRAAAAAWSKDADVPELASAMAWGNAPCTTWFGHAARTPGPAATTTAAPILVVGTTYDPATPYWWSRALSRQLPTSTLLTYDGDGHTAYGAGSRCIDRAIDAYLLDGTMPAGGTICR